MTDPYLHNEAYPRTEPVLIPTTPDGQDLTLGHPDPEQALARRRALADKLVVVIETEQERIAALPESYKVWHDGEARAWSHGMSNAARLVREALLTGTVTPLGKSASA